MTSPASLIAIDWGTSSLRGFLMAEGRVLEARQRADAGVQHLAGDGPAAFGRAFDALTHGWGAARLPIVACGMVGSAQGWREMPYVPCPADAAAIASAAGSIDHAGTAIVVAPGVMHSPSTGAPDVMRGEETQVLGALQHDGAWARRSCVVLPGTHSKWVSVRDGRIDSLRTSMTGEVFSVLRTHTILGRLMSTDTGLPTAPGEAFERGLDAARDEGDLLHALFGVRTLALTKQLRPEDGADYLSGLLIGSELRAASQSLDASTPLLLVGDEALCRRYAAALARTGRPAVAQLGNTAPQGLWALARARGLVHGGRS